MNPALEFILRNVDTVEYRYFYAHENNNKRRFGFTSRQSRENGYSGDNGYSRENGYSAQERENTKWRFVLTTNETICCALLKNIPMGCIDAVLPEQLLRSSK